MHSHRSPNRHTSLRAVDQMTREVNPYLLIGFLAILLYAPLNLGADNQASLQAFGTFDFAAVEGAWVNADPAFAGDRQGLLFDYGPSLNLLFMAWFSYTLDPAVPTVDPPTDIGSPDQRWMTALLALDGNRASGTLSAGEGGQFAAPPTGFQRGRDVGTFTVEFSACDRGTFSFDIAEPRLSGEFDIVPLESTVSADFQCQHSGPPPVRKLRWPHAPPGLSEAAYQELIETLWVINNFPQHQGADPARPNQAFFHDGLDVVLDNGTTVYALADGVVRSIDNHGDSGSSVVIQDSDQPDMAWGYVHINPQVASGAQVQAGDPLGVVMFQGLEHLHLSRLQRNPAAPGWVFWQQFQVNPTAHFDFVDTEPPVFEQRLRFFPNQSDAEFAPGEPVRVGGAVDIVAGIRDPGEYSRGLIDGLGGDTFGDRLSVARIEYQISGNGQPVRQYTAFDFRQLRLRRPAPNVFSQSPLARIVYKPFLLLNEPVDFNRIMSYYVLTNSDGTGNQTELVEADRLLAWDTAARADDGSRLFPNGTYTITVHALDYAGNSSEFSDQVEVFNGN